MLRSLSTEEKSPAIVGRSTTPTVTDSMAIAAFRCTNGDFYVALGSSMGLELLVLVGVGLLKRVLYYFCSGQKCPMRHLTRLLLVVVSTVQC